MVAKNSRFSTIIIIVLASFVFLGSCETLDKLVAGEPLVSGNIMEEKNTREGAQTPGEGDFFPTWLQGKWAEEAEPEQSVLTITPNEVLYLGMVGFLQTSKDKLMEDRGYKLEFFVKTDEENLFELDAGADNQYTEYLRATKAETGITLKIVGIKEGAEINYLPITE